MVAKLIFTTFTILRIYQKQQLDKHTHIRKAKAFTSSNHQELEKLLVGHMRNISTREAYSDLLQLFYNYFGAIEAQVDEFIGPAVLADYTQRRKTKSLENDITALGGTANRTIQAKDVPAITSILQAFGALYVMEGSTLRRSTYRSDDPKEA